MSKTLDKSTERIQPNRFQSIEEYLVFLRHLAAYEFVLPMLSQEMKVIDYGSGEGYGSLLLSKKCKKVIGLDINEMSVNHARVEYQNEACEFKLIDGLKIPENDNSVDAVISFQVIEHVPDVQAYLGEINRVLKDDGFYVCTTPNRLYRLRPGEKPWNPFHLREYSPDHLEAELQVAFNNVDLRGVHGTEEAHRIEVDRAQANWTLKSKLARSTPNVIKEVVKAVSRLIRKPSSTSYLEENQLSGFQSSDYFVKKTEIRQSLDLLGICRKS